MRFKIIQCGQYFPHSGIAKLCQIDVTEISWKHLVQHRIELKICDAFESIYRAKNAISR